MDRDETKLAVLAAMGALSFGVLVFIIFPAPLSILFLGAVLGSLSALVAMGIVLVYRANRIVNFAQGSLGAVAAVLAASLIVSKGWNFWLAIAAGLLAAVALGGIVEVAFVRRFAKAPRLVLTVATIGIAQLCDALSLLLPKLFNLKGIPQPQPFKFTFEWYPVVFNGGHVLILVTVPIVVIGLTLFFRRSRVGVAVRASSESADRAALLGIPVKRINTLVWIIAAGMAGLATVLRLPIQGVPIGSVLGPVLLFRALAAAVIGRMENLAVTFTAAVILGMVQQAALFETGNSAASDAVLFAVIIVALLVQRGGGLERARLTGASTWAAIREVRPIPRELRRLPEIRLGVIGLSGLAVLALVVVPLTWNPSRINLFTVGVISAIIMCSLLIITGFAGQISLGHLAIVALSGAVAGSMAQDGKEFFSTMLVAGLVGAGVAIAIGVPALKITGPFFAVTSLGFAVATGTFFLNSQYFAWLVPKPNVRILRPVIFNKFDLESEYAYYYFVLAVFALVAVSVWRIRTSRTGRVIVANRDNTRAAQAYGISSMRAQLTAFALSGFIAGLAGALYVFHQHRLSDTLQQADTSILLLAIAIVGGLSSLPGAMLGAAYLTFLNYSSFTARQEAQLLASGVGVLFILMVLPSGLGGLFYDARDRLLRTVARARGVVVPSLLADVRVLDDDDATLEMERPSQVSQPSADPLLLVQGLEVSYGRTQVLFGVDFHVERGEIVALLGTNGAGKSTLLSAIAGLASTGAGTVTFDGADITGDQPTETVAKGVVFMPGGKGVFPTLTVAENLDLAAWLFSDEPDYVREVTEQVLDMFPILRERHAQKAGNLSGGEQQMLTLAQAFILRPRLLMIDELSLGLAPVIVEQLLGIVRAIHANGTTVVLVEQSVNVAITLADRAVFLEKGEVRFDGPTSELLERPEILRSVFLEGAASKSSPGAVEPARNGASKAVYEPMCAHCGREHPVALDVDGLSVNFGGVMAVQDVSFAIREGQILGIIGPNGAGKTTVLDLISGFLVPTAGRVSVMGTDVTELAPDARAMAGLGRSFQDARLFSSMTVRQTIATALERHIEVRDPLAALLLSPAVAASEKVVDEEVTRLIDLMRLGAYADKFVGELSTGTRRVVDLACTLAHRPSVLLLDEPSSGIAQRETEALGPVLLDIRDQTGAAMVVIEHDMPLICGISDELLALELGSVVARGVPDVVIHDPRVIEGYLGGDQAVIHRSDAEPTTAGNRSNGSNGTKARRRTPLKAGAR